MSIDTLLEAAKFLEWQAQQQQKAREENELREKLRLEQEAEKKRAEVSSIIHPIRVNHVSWGEEPCPESRIGPVPPPALPPPLPFTVIPIPVVSAGPAPLPPAPPPLHAVAATTLSSPPGSRPSPPRKDTHSPPVQPTLPTQQRIILASQVKVEPTSPPHLLSTKQQPQAPPPQAALIQSYPGSIITTSQHALLPQPPPLQAQPGLPMRPSSLDDARQLDGKRRPGGAGTREVHNKLEKNRRAHLKECFETLKKNIPNVDEKKTSNLSVLRSALRYIQTLKRKEKEYEHEMERLAREKIATQQRLAELKNELLQWMDVMEVDRVLRQTVQPEDDQVSTSTASEGEDNIDDDIEEETTPLGPAPLPKVPHLLQPDVRKQVAPQPTLLAQHIAIQHKMPAAPTQAVVAPQGHTHLAPCPTVQPTVIAHTAAASHASVIQTVNHVIQAGPKHVAHIAPSPGAAPIGHITVATLGQHLPTLYSQPVAVTQPAVVRHIAHTLSHGQVDGAAPSQQTTTQVVAHHPQLVGQTVLNPVTMVTMPSFPVSTLKLA